MTSAPKPGKGEASVSVVRTGMSLVPRHRWGLVDAAGGVVAAMLLVMLLGSSGARAMMTDAHAGLLLSYLVVWLPLLGAVLIACFLRGSRSLNRDFGLRVRPLDLLWGLSIGLLARVVASLVEIAVYGRPAPPPAVLGVPVYDGWWLFGALLAPVLIAPLIEEVFFRGLLLRAVRRSASANGGSQATSLAIAVVVSGAVFALVHVQGADSVSASIVVGLSTFVFGLAAASVAALTGRLGGALIAHVTFNALVVLPAVLPLS